MIGNSAGDDATLAAAVAAGDADALGVIYDRYAPQLLALCQSVLHDDDEAQNCLQAVFAIAGSRLGDLEDPAMLRPWLFSVTRYECLIRLLQHELEYREEDDGEFGAEAIPPPVPADASAVPGRDRLLLELADRHGLSGAEFAAALGVSASAAETMLARARNSAKKAVSPDLLARAAGEKCPELKALLAGSLGPLTALQTKQVQRHAAGCGICSAERTHIGAVTALLGGTAEATAARDDSVRGRILAMANAAVFTTHAGLTVDPWEHGWPPADPEVRAGEGRRRRGLLAALAVAALVLAAGAVVAASALGSDHKDAATPDVVPISSASNSHAAPPIVVVTQVVGPTATSAPTTAVRSTSAARTSARPTQGAIPAIGATSTTPPYYQTTTPYQPPAPQPQPSSSTHSQPKPTKSTHSNPSQPKPTKSTPKPKPTHSSPSHPKPTPSSQPPSSEPPPSSYFLTISIGRIDANVYVSASGASTPPCTGTSTSRTSCTYRIPVNAAVSVATSSGSASGPGCGGQACLFTMSRDFGVSVEP